MVQLGLILFSLLWIALATGAGRTVLRASGFRFAGRMDALLFSLAAGFTLTSYLLFGIGTLLGLGPFVVWVLGAILVSLTLVGLWERSRGAKEQRSRGAEEQGRWRLRVSAAARQPLLSVVRRLLTRWPVTLLLGLLLIHASLNLLAALAPPTTADSLLHHLAAPKYFLAEGRIAFKPYPAWPTPGTAEMWNLLGLLLGSDRLSQLFQCLIGLASAAALYQLARQRMTASVALLGSAIYYTLPDVTILASNAKSDLAMLLFAFLSLHSLLLWRESGEGRWLALSGFLTGMAAATKIQGLFWCVAMGLVVLVAVLRAERLSWTLRVRGLVLFGLLAVLAVSPWYLRNWLAGGDPVWPYGYALFKSRYWSEQMSRKFASWQQGPGTSFVHYLLGLWNLTNRSDLYVLGWKFPKSPIPLAFLPALPLALFGATRSARRLMGWLLLAFVGFYSAWFYTYQQPRYLLPGFALLAVLAAYTYLRLLHLPLVRRVGGFVIVCSLGLMLGYNVAYNAQFLPVVLGLEPEERFLNDRVIFYRDIQWSNENLPSDARPYLAMNYLKPYYFDHLYLRSEDLDTYADPITGPEDFLARLKAQGATHLFYPSSPPETVSPEADGLVGPLIEAGYLRLIHTNPNARIVESRTLGRFRGARVDIYAIDYP